jgi:pimeloyl-ACP methyl ester carboxylesterase
VIFKQVLILALGVALGGCTVALQRNSVVLDNQTVAAKGIKLPEKPTKDAQLPSAYHQTIEDIPASFGTLHTVLVESDPEKPLIVFCGGNSFREETAGAPFAEALAPFGDILFYDYPGYGSSGGEGTRPQFAEAEQILLPKIDALAAARKGPVIFWGHSLGGGICASLAAHSERKSALLLAATFASYGDMKDDMLGIASGLVRLKIADDLITYQAPELLKDYTGPIVVVALSEDETIPFAVSRKLADKLKAEGKEVRFVALEGTGHSRIHGHPEFRGKVKAALKSEGVDLGE